VKQRSEAPQRQITNRREVLRVLVATTGAAMITGQLSGCVRNDDPATSADSVSVALNELAPGVRVQVDLGGEPVEVLRTESGISARSLLCSHVGCVVEWREGEQVYHCPCHEGRYDSRGRVLSGPPPRPLEEFPVELQGEAVIIRRTSG
jgi:Rieske Fe-S protein